MLLLNVNDHIKAHLALFIVAIIYGANYLIAKSVMDTSFVKPMAFVAMRIVFAGIMFSIIHVTIIKESLDRKDLWYIIMCALCGVIINQIFFFKGLHLTKPINASLLMTATPVLVIIVSAIVLKERITAKKIFGVCIALVGALIIILSNVSDSAKSSSLLGDIYIFINVTAYAVYLVIVRKMLLKYHPYTLFKWMFLIGSVVIIPIAGSDFKEIAWSSLEFPSYLAIAYVLLLTTMATYALNAFALKKLMPSVVAVYIYLQPFIASFLSVFFEKDDLTLNKILAGIFIFFGVYLVSIANVEKKTKTQR